MVPIAKKFPEVPSQTTSEVVQVGTLGGSLDLIGFVGVFPR